MPVNANPEYVQAEAEFHKAKNSEEKLEALEKMISLAPKHKSSENMLANLKSRYKKLKEQVEVLKKKSKSRSNKTSIKKEDMQAVIVGNTNVGKSSLLDILTNVNPKIAEYSFTTKSPLVGIMPYLGTNIQLIENPAIESEYYDKGLSNTADTLIILITGLEQIGPFLEKLKKSIAEKIIIFNKSDLFSKEDKRKIEETLKSKRYNYEIISIKEKQNIDSLKEKIFKSFKKIRIYTKEPGKSFEQKNERPIILAPGSIIQDVAEKILKGFSNKVKETRIWGPSSKFPGQIVSLKHELKDLDIVEFKVR
ncbi:MAG: GTPase [Nanoarchaeota archaeon]